MIEMPFKDKYTRFWFNDISSETMKVWVTNNKDIEFKATPNFTDAFVNPVASQVRYHTNTTISSNDFQVKCIAIGVNMLEWRAIENWLSPLTKGKLQFDFNDNTYYNVKVSKQVKGNVFVAGSNHIYNNDTYNIEFTVEFTTTSDWAALGPQVVVPINETYKDNAVVEMTLIDSPVATVSKIKFVSGYTYNYMTADSTKWDQAEWWRLGLSDANTDHQLIKAALTGSQSSSMVECLKNSLAAYSIVSLSSSINNKFAMPVVYNKTMSNNTIYPEKGEAYIKLENRKGRKYITEPTILINKTIYLDEVFYEDFQKSEGGGGGNYSNYNYYLLDSAITHTGTLSTTINFKQLTPHVMAYIRQQTLQSGKHQMILTNYHNDSEYGIVADIPLGGEGVTFYGTSVLFVASSADAYKYCPFYYLEDDNTYAIMNAGSYDCYPDLFLDLGLTVKTEIKKEQELLYDYEVAVQNTALNINGKTGFVTFNNQLAESAALVGDAGKTKIVVSSTNNGVLAIEPGKPELLKVRVFGINQPILTRFSDKPQQTEPIGITQIFFQPVGEFKYPRNGKFAALLFSHLKREAVYNEGFYPLVNESFVNASIYGSKVEDYLFTINGFVSYGSVSANTNMWVLTIPTKDFTDCSLCDPSKVESTGYLKTPQYMYLSLCDYTDVSITTDTSMSSYIMMQTRDAY